MEPVTKRVRIEQPLEARAQLKPSQVTQQSNIFGPVETKSKFSLKGAVKENDDNEDQSGSDEEIESDSDASGDSNEGSEELDDEFDMEQTDSSSDEGDNGVDDEDDNEEDVGEHDGEEGTTQPGQKRKKKNDPSDFANAMQKILSSGLTTTNRKNPILARSLESKKLDELADDERLELKVRKQMTAEKKAKLDKNHNSVVVGEGDAAAEIIERERNMRKVAQRGVVRLFNAIRSAQLAAQDPEEVGGERDARTGLKVRQGAGVKKREVKAQEMSKTSFLDLIKAGGRGSSTT